MPSTYSPSLKIELIPAGGQTNQWAPTTNNNFQYALEEGITGYATATFPSDAQYDWASLYTNTNTSQAQRNLVIQVTSSVSLTATQNLIVPTISKQYIVYNNTTGGQSIQVKTSAGTGVTIPNGKRMHVFVDGTNAVQMVDYFIAPTVSSINKVVITAPATAATFTLANNKTFTVNNSITLSGTDSTVMTLPSTNATLARIDAGQTFTGTQTFASNLAIHTTNSITVGRGAQTSNIYNTALGVLALSSVNLSTGDYNTALGRWALKSATDGSLNTAVGYNALSVLTTGQSNVAVGRLALGAGLLTGNHNVAVGDSAGVSATAAYNTFIGTQAGRITTGNSNNFIGYQSGYNNTSGTDNTGIGYQSLVANNTGYSNLAIGSYALQNSTSSYRNVALGNSALSSHTSGYDNVAISPYALYTDQTGYQNVAIGASALYSSNGAINNVAIGDAAGNSLTSGDNNTFLGAFSYTGITGGSNNTCIGASSGGYTTGNYSNTSCLGYATGVTGNNQVQLGSSTTTTYVYGTVQNRSDARDKTDVRNTQLGLKFIKSLRPVDYKWDMRDDYRSAPPVVPASDATEVEKIAYQKQLSDWQQQSKLGNIVKDGSKKRARYHHGLIAQEVKRAMEMHNVDFGGYQDHKVSGGDDVLSIGYVELIAPLIKAIQELSAEVEALKSARG